MDDNKDEGNIDRLIQLSIIIPHFNNGNLLDKLLSSILSECGRETQIIVVDDNSTEFLDEYNTCKHRYKERIEFYVNPKEVRSAGECRNIGIDHADGRWLLFCDADDYLLKGWHLAVSNYFDKATDVVFFYPTAVKLKSDCPSKRADAYRMFLTDFLTKNRGAEIRLRTRFVTPVSKLIRTDLIRAQNIRFDSTLYGNDVIFYTKLGLAMNLFEVSKQEIYCITEGTRSLTKQMTRESLRIRAEVAVRRVAYIKKRISFKEWLQTGLGSAPVTYVLKAIKRGYGLEYIKSIVSLFHNNDIHILNSGLLLSPLSFLAIIRKWP